MSRRRRRKQQNNQLPGCLIWIALAIFFLPIVLIPMWLFKRDWSIKKKTIISVILLLGWCLFIGYAYSREEQTADPVATQTISTPITTAAQTVDPTAEPIPAQTPIPTQSETRQTWVWLPTDGGKKYHAHSGCSGMENPIRVTIEDAISRGFDACGKCY